MAEKNSPVYLSGDQMQGLCQLFASVICFCFIVSQFLFIAHANSFDVRGPEEHDERSCSSCILGSRDDEKPDFEVLLDNDEGPGDVQLFLISLMGNRLIVELSPLMPLRPISSQLVLKQRFARLPVLRAPPAHG